MSLPRNGKECSQFVVGDVVTRDGKDEQEIVSIDRANDMMTTRFLKEATGRIVGRKTKVPCPAGAEETHPIYRYCFVRSAGQTEVAK